MINPIASLIADARNVVVFTGAGISTESGIPDFRSPGGIWSQAQPVYFDDFLRSPEARAEYWRQKTITHHEFSAAKPNRGHQVLADWERRGIIRGIITQNIDGYHQQAGSENVLELHGTAREVSCLACARRWSADGWVAWYELHQRAPDCPECGGPLKHATISFGQPLETAVLESAVRWSSECDLFLALGSSLVVQPAAGLPVLAQSHGVRLVIINRDPTPLDGNADLRWNGDLGESLEQIDRLLTAS